ncbi:protein FAR1-RELATED SEQUENCE 5-like protein [Corchorus olitorius]|uniref:Protein FAR1-RELATED SEQUENCE n=1 Tax=Corchorus olitorius TaxID=93759 RepID=A0A1R3HL74_9ROSI|nr:protein FAR1-RELATED SEQUENCE 5-like protein [Corchorus olitorius]
MYAKQRVLLFRGEEVAVDKFCGGTYSRGWLLEMDPGLSMFDLNDPYVVDVDSEDEDVDVSDHRSRRRPRLTRAEKEAERVPHPYFLKVDPRNLQPSDVVGVREEQYYSSENRKRSPKLESRINCGAHMRILRNGSKWIMVREFKLENNEWVREKYRTKRMWAQAFITGDFFATLKSTSRCEGMHSYMKRYVKHTGTLFEFMHAIDRALDSIRQLELQANYQSRFFKHVTRGSPLEKIEEDGAGVYTKRAFERFRKEVRRENLYYCNSSPTLVSGGGRKYTLRRHQVSVMKMENLVSIPRGMVCRRWTKDAGNISSYKPRYRVDEKERELFRHVSLRVLCNRLCELGSKSDEAFEEAKRRLEEICHDIVNNRFARADGNSWQPCPNGNEWFDREDTGRDRAGRAPRPTPGRCGHFGRTGHTIRKCPYINMDRMVVRNRGVEEENTDYDESDEEAIFGQEFPYLQVI